jgi:hypothetical protein
MGHFWNEKRLKNYPRLIFVGVWIAIGLNLILHRGWSGGFGGVIGVDFISNYASGLQYRFDVKNLYSLQAQYEFQQRIYQQKEYIGQYSIFPSPPYVAFINSFSSLLPFGYAFAIWTFLSIISGLISLYLIEKYLIPTILRRHLTFSQLFILVFGFPPMVFGLMFGQNHLITILLITGILILSIKERWLLVGILLGLLIYKPHLVIGFLIVFLLRRRLKALAGFSLITIVWAGAVVMQHGIAPYLKYFEFTGELLNIPNQTSMLDTTVFALLVSVSHGMVEDFIHSILPYWIFAFSVLLGTIVTTPRVKTSRVTEYILAILFPFIVSPHILIYDILPLLFVIVLWAKDNPSPKLVDISVYTYLSILVLVVLAKLIEISLIGCIPIFLCYLVLRNLVLTNKNPDGTMIL